MPNDLSRFLTKLVKDQDSDISSFFDKIIEGIIIVNHESKVVFVNKAIERIFGFSKAELLFKNEFYKMIVPIEFREKHIEGWTRFQKSGKGRVLGDIIEIEGINKQGSRIPIEMTISALEVENHHWTMAVIRDILERKALKEALQNERIRINSQKVQKSLINTISHEFKTPITSIKQSAGILDKYKNKISEQKKEDLLKNILSNSDSLNLMVEKIFEISKLAQDEIKNRFREFNLKGLFNEIRTELASTLEEKMITLETSEIDNSKIIGDFKSLKLMFTEIIKNSLSYSPAQSTIWLKNINPYQGPYNTKNKNGILIEMIDSGKGIPEKDLPFIFEMFYRSKEVENIKGIGLGLNFAQYIVNAHNGEIFIHNSDIEGTGTIVSIFLPQ